MAARQPVADTCPCGNPAGLAACCGRYLDGAAAAPTAEALMRSRYSAYVLQREDYLLSTWHPMTRPAALHLARAVQPQWIDLNVKRHTADATGHAVVEFVARHKLNGRAHRLHETSRFALCEDGRWYYIDGTMK